MSERSKTVRWLTASGVVAGLSLGVLYQFGASDGSVEDEPNAVEMDGLAVEAALAQIAAESRAIDEVAAHIHGRPPIRAEAPPGFEATALPAARTAPPDGYGPSDPPRGQARTHDGGGCRSGAGASGTGVDGLGRTGAR